MAKVWHDSRICFGIDFYDDEAEAVEAAKTVREAGESYNGGWFHGMPCGRAKHFDYFDKERGLQLYAVTRG